MKTKYQIYWQLLLRKYRNRFHFVSLFPLAFCRSVEPVQPALGTFNVIYPLAMLFRKWRARKTEFFRKFFIAHLPDFIAVGGFLPFGKAASNIGIANKATVFYLVTTEVGKMLALSAGFIIHWEPL